MNKRQFIGAWKEIKGEIVKQVGKLIGDKEMEMSGSAEDVRGKIQKAAAGINEHIAHFAKVSGQWVRIPKSSCRFTGRAQ